MVSPPAADQERPEPPEPSLERRLPRKRPKDVTRLHGHHVVTGPELRATFADDADRHPGRFGRRLFHGIVLALLLGIIAAAVLGAWAVMNGVIKLPSAVTTKPAASLCPAGTFDYVPNQQVKLNVFNATSRSGLATTVAAQFTARGYPVGSVDNSGTTYSGIGMVVSGVKGQAGAFNIQRNLAGTDYVQDNRGDDSVDVILTSQFRTLVAPELVDQTPGTLSCPREDRRIAEDSRWPVIPTAVPSP